MAENINIGDSFFKEVSVTYREDGEDIPVDLSIYDDNYIAIKKSRSVPDSDAYIFKRIYVTDKTNGILTINLSPDETAILPVTSDEMRYIEGFVQIGSTVNGQVHEVSSFRIKTKPSGIGHITPVDKSFDMGCITDATGWIFDAGNICEVISSIENFGSSDGIILYNGGTLLSNSVEIIDFGNLDLHMPERIDFGELRVCNSKRCSL